MSLDSVIMRMSSRQRLVYFERLLSHEPQTVLYRRWLHKVSCAWLLSYRGF